MGRHWVDITAVGFFIIEWLVYALTLEHSAYGRDSLSARMNRYREVWVRNMLDREARMWRDPRWWPGNRDVQVERVRCTMARSGLQQDFPRKC